MNNCGRKHHTSLHEYYANLNPTKKRSTDENKSSVSKSETKEQFNGVLDEKNTEIYLQIVPVILKGRNGNEIKTYALLDSGSKLV